MDQHEQTSNPQKPEWALTRRERKRAALEAAGIAPWKFPIVPVIFVLVIAAAAALIIPRFIGTEASAPVAEVAQPSAPVTKQLLSIDVATAAARTVSDIVKATGSLAPRRNVTVASKVAGTIQDVAVRIGDTVKAGDVLVRIDVEASTIQLQQQRATAAATRAQLAQAEAQLERTVGLAERGLTPGATVESERAAAEALRANLQALEAGVAGAEIAIRNATVVAPYDGVVASRAIEPGQVITAGAELVSVVDLSVMELTVYVPVNSSTRILPGQPVTLSVEGLADRNFEGVVEGISPIATAGTRTVPVLVSVENEGSALRGGMFATGQIVVDVAEGAITVPAAAIHEDAEGSYLLGIEDGVLSRKPVQVGRAWTGSAVQIDSGLEPGEVFVAARFEDLEPGLAVTIVEN